MAEPVWLYPKDGGEGLPIAAPSEVRKMLASGEWALEPMPAPKPTPKPAPEPQSKGKK